MDLPGLVVGGVASALGAACMLLGYRLALVLLPLWGFLAGFLFGAQLVATLLADGFLATTIGWVVAAVVGLVIGALSYVYWYVAVAVVFASVGSWLAWGVMPLVGFEGTRLVTFTIGLLVGGGLAIVGLLTGVRLAALVVITAVGGAHAVVAGVLVVLGTIEVEALGTGMVDAVIGTSIGWWLAALGVALISITIQLRTIGDFVLEPPATRL